MITKEGLNIFSYHFISFPFEFVREKKKIRFYTKLAAAADCRQSKKKTFSLSKSLENRFGNVIFLIHNKCYCFWFVHACMREEATFNEKLSIESVYCLLFHMSPFLYFLNRLYLFLGKSSSRNRITFSYPYFCLIF